MKKFRVVKSLIMFLLVFLVLGISGYFLVFNIQQSFKKGEKHSELDNKIFYELSNSVKIGLEKFKLLNNHYPKYEGKYFLDSIKRFISVPEVYVYADSLGKNGKYNPIKKNVGKNFNYRNIPNTYLGISNNNLPVIYKYVSDNFYKLYFIGENGLDEDGKGDDVNAL